MGEGQKAVSKAYKENWNAIFGKKKKRWTSLMHGQAVQPQQFFSPFKRIPT
jgi:hypothetical protein